jgi:xanthine dehydrogenase FAD-binding subunit
MYLVEDYFAAKSVEEALDLLADNPQRHIIAGGTDLLLKMRDGLLENVQLISIRDIESLSSISLDEEQSITIGPLTTFKQLAVHPLIQKNIPILTEAALSVGGPQIRDMATIGGNICNGVPSADSAPPLLALDALLKLQSQGSERLLPVGEFFLGPGRVDLQPGELLTEILITADNYRSFGGCYIKFAPRKAMDLAIIGVAVTCRLHEKDTFERVRISLGVAGPIPLRCSAAETYAQGKTTSDNTVAEIGKMAVESARARNSVRASKEYREHLIDELTRRALKTAVSRAGRRP